MILVFFILILSKSLDWINLSWLPSHFPSSSSFLFSWNFYFEIAQSVSNLLKWSEHRKWKFRKKNNFKHLHHNYYNIEQWTWYLPIIQTFNSDFCYKKQLTSLTVVVLISRRFILIGKLVLTCPGGCPVTHTPKFKTFSVQSWIWKW